MLRRAPSVDEHNDARRALPFGTLAFVGALGSLVTCYGSIVLKTALGVSTGGMNPHVQAAVMWGFGLLAIWGLWRDRRRHGREYPLLIGTTGVAVLITTLYVHYEARFEVLAYMLLVIGALLNQTAMVSGLYGTTLSQKQVIEDLNQNLEQKVERQVRHIESLDRLRDFLPPAVADLVLTGRGESLLDSHRQHIACLFCDIRNFTSLAEKLEPEETIALLQAYHTNVGELVSARGGTIGYRAGDGFMVFFNDPVPCERPVLEAVQLALEIHRSWQNLRAGWERLGHSAGIGIGIASGYATLGLVGRKGRADYTAIGNVVNLASRLCDEARDGDTLLDRRAWIEVEDTVEAVPCGAGQLDGITEQIEIFRVERLLTAQAGTDLMQSAEFRKR